MRILVLGASSRIGAALSEAFSPQNNLVLVGRNTGKLADTAEACVAAGALRAECVQADFSISVDPLLLAIGQSHIDLVIDAASASSAKRDSDISGSEIRSLLVADFSSRTLLIEHLSRKQDTLPVSFILISTILALIKSPDRVVYSASKEIYEVYLAKWRDSRPGNRLFVVHVGAVIDRENDSEAPQKLASAVLTAFRDGKQSILYGMVGRFYVILFYTQPVVFRAVAFMQRRLRALTKK